MNKHNYILAEEVDSKLQHPTIHLTHVGKPGYSVLLCQRVSQCSRSAKTRVKQPAVAVYSYTPCYTPTVKDHSDRQSDKIVEPDIFVKPDSFVESDSFVNQI